MLILIWLIIWLISAAPPLVLWNAWVVSGIICGAISFLHLAQYNSR